MHIPFISPIYCVWRYPLRFQMRVKPNPLEQAIMQGLRASMQQGSPSWSEASEPEPQWHDSVMAHWSQHASPDDMPDEMDIKDLRPGSLVGGGLERFLCLGGRKSGLEVYHRRGHTWIMQDSERAKTVLGLCAGTTRRPWIANRWVATGNTNGMHILELPKVDA